MSGGEWAFFVVSLFCGSCGGSLLGLHLSGLHRRLARLEAVYLKLPAIEVAECIVYDGSGVRRIEGTTVPPAVIPLASVRMPPELAKENPS